MKPVKCLTVEGDCVRACIASLLELNPLMVPDFFADGVHAIQGWKAVDDFLKPMKLKIAQIGYPAADLPLDDFIMALAVANPGITFMLTGQAPSGRNHMVLICDGKIVHDPSWSNTGLTAPIGGDFPMWRLSLLTPVV